jgi:membrane protein YdbS with pleckstrin-like domain
MDEKSNKLRKMAAWTIAIFATILAIAFALLWLPIYPQSNNAMAALGQVFASGWLVLVLDLVLCAGVYFGYRYFVNSKR